VKKEREMKTYKIRVTGEVLSTSTATRRCIVAGHVLTFGREPVYLQAAQLPPELDSDRHLKIEVVETAPPGVEVIRLKAERVEEPAAADSLPDEDGSKLKAERVEEPQAADTLPETRLKAERVELPEAAATTARPGTRRR
jgi:hypothetical protein